MNQLLDVVALGQAVAFVPLSVGRRHSHGGLVFVPVTDLSPGQVVAAWPESCRSLALARFIRLAAEVAAGADESVDRAASIPADRTARQPDSARVP